MIRLRLLPSVNPPKPTAKNCGRCYLWLDDDENRAIRSQRHGSHDAMLRGDHSHKIPLSTVLADSIRI
jgi:hypothetical protein